MKKVLRSIVVDDEEFCRRDLVETLQQISQVKVVAEASDLRQAVELTQTHQPDVLFLDLNLHGESGFHLLHQLSSVPAVVAVTAFSEHAANGFSHDFADYILKPADVTRIEKALHRARSHILVKSLALNSVLNLEINGKTRALSITDIHEIRSSENYVEVHSVLGVGLIRSTFAKMIQRLPAGFCLEVGRGRVIARHQIRAWQRDKQGHLIINLKSGADILVSKRSQKQVLQDLSLLGQ
jgi:two-component system LytT family response regulator